MLEVRDLELVETVLAHGSFVRAARVLGVSQPGLTRHVAALEQRLQGPLFVRRNNGVEQTELCRTLMTEAGDLLDRFRALRARMGHARSDGHRDLSIVAGSYAAETIGMTALAQMLTLRPQVQVRFGSLNYLQALTRLRDREAELAIVEISEVGADSDLVVAPLRRHPGAFAVRAGHPLAGRAGVTLPEIMGFPLCLLARAPGRIAQPLMVARHAAQASGTVYPAFPASIIESPTAALLAARSSDAIVAVTGSLVLPWIRSGEIVLLRWHEPWLCTNFGIVNLRARPPSGATETFIGCLRQADEAAEADDAALLAAVTASTPDAR